MALETEMAFFNSQKEELVRHNKGQYAVIKQTKLLGTFTTFEEAFEAGVRELGNQSFLIKQVTDKEEEAIQYPALSVGLLYADL